MHEGSVSAHCHTACRSRGGIVANMRPTVRMARAPRCLVDRRERRAERVVTCGAIAELVGSRIEPTGKLTATHQHTFFTVSAARDLIIPTANGQGVSFPVPRRVGTRGRRHVQRPAFRGDTVEPPRLRWRSRESGETALYTALLSTTGVDPLVELKVATNRSGELPDQLAHKIDDYLAVALRSRPYLQAALAKEASARALSSRGSWDRRRRFPISSRQRGRLRCRP